VSKNKTKKYEGSEHELHVQTLELDELHHDVGMPAMAEALGHMRSTSRRTFLMGPARPWPEVRRWPSAAAPYRRWLRRRLDGSRP